MIALLQDKIKLKDEREITVIKRKCALLLVLFKQTISKWKHGFCRSMNKNHLEPKMDLCHKTLTYH